MPTDARTSTCQGSNGQSGRCVKVPGAIAVSVLDDVEAISDGEDDDSVDSTDVSTAAALVAASDRKRESNALPPSVAPATAAAATIAVATAAATCRSCGEEPFGFMVKCQRCKLAFHAGCVKPPDGKRRLSHVFRCSSCALQRPTKTARVDRTSSSSSPSTGSSSRQSAGAASAVVRRPLV